MENYIYGLAGARLYIGSAETPVGKAIELTLPLEWRVSNRMNTLVVVPHPNVYVIQGTWSDGKVIALGVSREVGCSDMGIATALQAKGVRLPRWVRYAIDAPNHPVVVYWKSIQ